MAKMVVLITGEAQAAHSVAAAWKALGAPGATFIEAYGLQSMRDAAHSMEILTGAFSMLDILRQSDVNAVILLSVLHDATLVPRMLEACEAELGDMQQPDKGIAFVLDVEQALGISQDRDKPS